MKLYFLGKISGEKFLTQIWVCVGGQNIRICMGCLPKHERNLLKIGLKNTYFQVFQGFPALKETVAHIQPNGQLLTVFGQNGLNRFFFKRAFGTFFAVKSPN